MSADTQLTAMNATYKSTGLKYNFGAGPSILPKEVFEEASQAIINFNNTGLSILEIGHRTKLFQPVWKKR